MEATILNTNFEAIGIIDTYKSFIWTDRYDECGDFEILMPVGKTLPENIQKDYYLWNAESEHMMIIETLSVESDAEEGASLLVKGRSLESILDRRIVWYKTTFEMAEDGTEPNLQNGIKLLLKENLIGPDEGETFPDKRDWIAVRKLSNFIFEDSTDERITKLTFEAQYLGEDLYTIVSTLCKENEIGFKVTFHDSYEKDGTVYNNVFVFKLYAGADRSYEQIENPYVIFSPDFDNIKNTNYLESYQSFKNTTLIVGESEYDENDVLVQRRQDVQNLRGQIHLELERREIFTDATSLSTDDGYGGTLSPERYQAHLRQKGIDTLIDHAQVKAFEAEVDPTNMYVYGEDYFIGDIVQVANEYGQEGRAYISEFIMSSDDTGISTYPTFKTIEKGEYDS